MWFECLRNVDIIETEREKEPERVNETETSAWESEREWESEEESKSRANEFLASVCVFLFFLTLDFLLFCKSGIKKRKEQFELFSWTDFLSVQLKSLKTQFWKPGRTARREKSAKLLFLQKKFKDNSVAKTFSIKCAKIFAAFSWTLKNRDWMRKRRKRKSGSFDEKKLLSLI